MAPIRWSEPSQHIAETIHTPLSLAMQPPPHPWTANDAVCWKAYANNMYAWLGHWGPHPGYPPDGYQDHYKKHNTHAPCPEDFPHHAPNSLQASPINPGPQPVQAPQPQAPCAITHLAGLGVHMSDDAFTAWMNHASSLHTHLTNIAFESTWMAGHAVNVNTALPQAAPVMPCAMLQVPPWWGGPPAAAHQGSFAAGC